MHRHYSQAALRLMPVPGILEILIGETPGHGEESGEPIILLGRGP